MLKKLFVTSLVILLINLTFVPNAFAGESITEKEAKLAKKVKTEITKLGVGVDSKVQVKLKNGIKIKGIISEINDEGFTVTDSEGNSTPVPYHSARQVGGGNTKTGLIIAAGIVIFLVIIAFAASKS